MFVSIPKVKERKSIQSRVYEYVTIKDIVRNPFWQATVELNDVIIPKCASQYVKCYVSTIDIKLENIDFIHKKHLNKSNDRY